MATILSDLRVELDPGEVLRYMGYPASRPAQRNLLRVCTDAVARATRLIRPAGIFEILGISQVLPDAVRLSSGERFAGLGIAALLRGCESAALLAVTAGASISEAVRSEFDAGSVTGAIALDAAGSDAAEKAADAVEAQIAARAAAEGLRLTRRYSPGYCDFDLAEQAVIFRLLDPGRIGVVLTASFYLLPSKSVTAVIGLFRGKARGARKLPCKECPRENCSYRK